MGIFGFAVVLCLGVFIIWLIYTYNRFVAKQSKIDEVWDEVDVHLQLRHDLIPVFIEGSKGRMTEEKITLSRIEELNALIADCETVRAAERYENELSMLMRSLRESVKKYPDMMTDEDFVKLLGELVSMEGRASVACDRHNRLVRDFNASITQFPATLIVGFLHLDPCEMRIFGVIDD